jgi:hypothetical protein
MEYNTQREQLVISEYGRNVHNMARHIRTLPTLEERNKAASSLIDIMAILNPQPKDVAEHKHKLWDHFFLIAGLDIEVDSPYPKPSAEVLERRPERLPYPATNIKIRHYGKILEQLIQEAVGMEEGPERQALCEYIANFMKLSYRNWNKSVINDEDIFQDLKKLSQGRIILSSESTVLEHFTGNPAALAANPRRPFNKNNKNKPNNNRFHRKNR